MEKVMRRLGLWLLTVCIVVVVNASAASALSLPGGSLDEAEKQDFFQFFHLKKRAIDERDDLATHYFRPPSRDDVVVCVDTDKAGKILQMSLIVGRDFIDHPATNVFARDLVKSFIEAATPAASASETSSLSNEIFLRGSKLTNSSVESVEYNGQKATPTEIKRSGRGDLKKGDAVLLMSGKLPKVPEKISDGFLAFSGKLENVDTPLTGAHLIFKNHEVANGRFLEVRIDSDSVKKVPKLEVIVDDAPKDEKEEDAKTLVPAENK
jgi:hypothetical protein